MSLTFRDIQNAVIKGGFDESDRSDVKNWITFRHAWLWDVAEWTFKQSAPTSVTFTSGSQTIGDVPADFSTAVLLYDSQGLPLQPIRDFREFFNLYNTNLNLGSSRPEAFTVIGSDIYVGPSGDGTTGLLVYQKTKPALVNDSDTTGLPDGYDLALVHGAKAEGFKLRNVPLWSAFDADFTAAVTTMQANYLVGIRGNAGQLGSYRPDQWC